MIPPEAGGDPLGYETYFETVHRIVRGIQETQRENIERAARLIADAVTHEGIIHAFGAGHSHMIVEELFCRAGGLGCVNGILEPALMPHSGADKASRLEQIPELARIVFEDEDIRRDDVLLIASQSGINPVIVEFAVQAHERHVPVIAITSLVHSAAVSSRHSSGRRLYEVADVAIDTGCPVGDAAMSVDGLPTRVAAMSTLAGTLIVQALVFLSVEEMVRRGFDPPLRVSRNLQGGQRNNLQYRARYGARIRRL
jgi:uncharacterized phosphosugar-binding protein